MIRYVGRRSGKTFEIPVGYRRSGGNLVIGVTAPDAKNWWRNFLGDGAPITLLNFNGGIETGTRSPKRCPRPGFGDRAPRRSPVS